MAALRRRASSHVCRYISSVGASNRAALCPPPIRVAITESAGRGVFATRSIRAGDLIHTAQPLLTHSSPSLLDKVCYYCLKRLGSNVTTISGEFSSCNFCSERCKNQSNKVFFGVERKVDWSLYDDLCRLHGVKYPLMVKRLACMVVSGAAAADSLDILQPANLTPPMVLEAEEEFKLLKCSFLKAKLEEPLLSFLTKGWYTCVLARIRINAFRIELAARSYEDLLISAASAVTAEAAVGNALYMLPSFYNHDCDPNTHIIWIDNADAKLKALRDIETGEELRICYIDASMEREARRNLLLEGFGFECQCQRCCSGD